MLSVLLVPRARVDDSPCLKYTSLLSLQSIGLLPTSQMRFACLLAVCLPLFGCLRAPPRLTLPQNFALECRSQRDHQFLGSRTGTEIFLRNGARWRVEFFSDSPAVGSK